MGMVTRRHFVTINFFLGRGQPERQGQGHEGTCPCLPSGAAHVWQRTESTGLAAMWNYMY